jgi:hypothetical protein
VAVCDRLLRQDRALAPAYFRRARLRAHQLEFFEAAADGIAKLALAARHRNGARQPQR